MEQFNVFEGIMNGLQEAVIYKQGGFPQCKVSVREIPVPEYEVDDVVRTRKALNLTQSAFALVLGVSPRTVEAWEAGRNKPSGAARHLLYLLDCDHSLV